MESWVDSKGSRPARLNNVKPKAWGPHGLVYDWQHPYLHTNTVTSHEQHRTDGGREYPYDLQYTERRIPSLTQTRDLQTHPGKHTLAQSGFVEVHIFACICIANEFRDVSCGLFIYLIWIVRVMLSVCESMKA